MDNLFIHKLLKRIYAMLLVLCLSCSTVRASMPAAGNDVINSCISALLSTENLDNILIDDIDPDEDQSSYPINARNALYVLDNPTFSDKNPLYDEYSRYKLGDISFINKFAHALADRIKDTIKIPKKDRQNWVIVTPPYNRILNSAVPLAREVADHVGLSFVNLRSVYPRGSTHAGMSFAELKSKEDRNEYMSSFEICVEGDQSLRGKKVIIIDDLYNTGASLEKVHKNLENDHGAEIVDFFVVVNLMSDTPGDEKTLGDHFLTEKGWRTFVQLLISDDVIMNRNSVSMLFSLPHDIFKKACSMLTEELLSHYLISAQRNCAKRIKSRHETVKNIRYAERLLTHMKAAVVVVPTEIEFMDWLLKKEFRWARPKSLLLDWLQIREKSTLKAHDTNTMKRIGIDMVQYIKRHELAAATDGIRRKMMAYALSINNKNLRLKYVLMLREVERIVYQWESSAEESDYGYLHAA